MALELRGCRAAERQAVINLTNRVFRSGGGDMGAAFPLLFGAANLEGLRIAVVDGEPVAHVGVCIRDILLLGSQVRVASIGAVCTHPAHRSRGLASDLMADARQYARGRGASLMLISGGRGLYHRLGYVTVGCFERYQVDAEQIETRTPPEIVLLQAELPDVPLLAALHQTESTRFRRTATDWRDLLNAGMLMNQPADLLLIFQQHQPVAYVAVQQPSAENRNSERILRIQELAGARSCIVAALPALQQLYRTKSTAFVVSSTDSEMAALARERGWRPTPQAFPGTLGVIDPPGLLDALWPVLSERVEAGIEYTIRTAESSVTFTWDGEACEVAAPGPLAALIFGGDTEEAHALPPCAGELGKLFRNQFPLPLVWPGYNYV